jgi:hypothetical protein
MSFLRFAKPSPAMAVSIVALVVATTGTATAATSLVNGNSLIKKHSLSGDRLDNHTLTGTQINVKKLGTVPLATKAKTLPALTWHNLTLINGWSDYNGAGDKRTPAYAVDAQGIVHFRGAIDDSGTFNDVVASLPKSIRPTSDVYVVVDTFVANTGRLNILSDGTLEVQDPGATHDTAAFTSLDGVTYALG